MALGEEVVPFVPRSIQHQFGVIQLTNHLLDILRSIVFLLHQFVSMVTHSRKMGFPALNLSLFIRDIKMFPS